MRPRRSGIRTPWLVALLALAVMAPASLRAGDEPDLEAMISAAKTPAEHEAIAGVYQKQAEQAAAAAAEHAKMADTYKKAGGSLVEKQHIDAHCHTLASLYEKIAKENSALAKAHGAMAKGAK